ncbi:MAG: aldehyde ferredoxin oxidoreductase family protein [Desulfosarcinaceae bacterium]|nr:aldehyde ferredoxin oxidoreductase family protein [Desulfosarcinaceae bacterium]
MQEIVGTSNRILDIDLSQRRHSVLTVEDGLRLHYLGGKGLGLRLLYDRLAPGTDPLGPANILAVMTGVFMGTGAPCSARFVAVAKSPLTGIMVASVCGGPFGMALKTAGYDGVLIHGRCEQPTILRITSETVSFESGDKFWGTDTDTCQAHLVSDKRTGALVIGPAGENRVPLANIASGHRFLGRGGLGAVMGAKGLKAIVAEGGAYRIVPEDPEGFKQLRKQGTERINRNPQTAEAYRTYGTSSHVKWCNEGGILPVRNFRDGRHAQALNVSGQAMMRRYKTRHNTCKPCSILCGHQARHPDGSTHAVPEYESIGLLGPNLGIFDPDHISRWNTLCGQLGLDTISTGAVLSWVMEAGEKGLIDTELSFGKPDGIGDAIESMAFREGFGNEMAAGTRSLSQTYGGAEFAIQVKGLEMAAYDPRGAWGQGLGYAVANRGACHLSAATFSLEVCFGLLNPYTTRAKARFVRFFEDLNAAINGLVTCQFTAYAYILETPIIKYTPKGLLKFIMQYLPIIATRLIDVRLYAQLYRSITGLPITQSKLLAAGRRIVTLERLMNTREGISRADDGLPARLTAESRRGDSAERKVPLTPMLDQYYRLRGYDVDGIPQGKTLQRLGILSGRRRRDGHTEDLQIDLPVPKVAGLRGISPRRRLIRNLYLQLMFWFMGRAVVAAARVDAAVQAEFDALEEGFTFALRVLPGGPCLVVSKDADGRPRYLGDVFNGMAVDLDLQIKHSAAAILLFTFRESTATSFAHNRIVVDGGLSAAMNVVRILDRVEILLLPRRIARLAVKRVPAGSARPGVVKRLRLYIRALIGG